MQTQPQTQSQPRNRPFTASSSNISNISRSASASSPSPDADLDANTTITRNNLLVNRDDDEDDSTRPRIPPALLTRLLHEFFTDDGTRISTGANRAVGKYMETFVREAIARAAFERQSEDVRVGGGFIEVRVISIRFQGGGGGRGRQRNWIGV